MKIVGYIFLCFVAGLVFSCAYQFPEVHQGPSIVVEKINNAENLVIKRKFAKAEEQFKDLLDEFPPGSPEHEVVLYNLVLLNLNRDNPDASSSEAKKYMDDFVRIYPRSHFRTAIFVVEQACKDSRNLKSCRNEIYRLRKALKSKDKSIKKLQAEIEAYKKIDWEREEKKRQIQK